MTCNYRIVQRECRGSIGIARTCDGSWGHWGQEYGTESRWTMRDAHQRTISLSGVSNKLSSSHLRTPDSKCQRKATRVPSFGRSTGPFTNSSRIGLGHLKSRVVERGAYGMHLQGYRVSDEEINMDLARFRELYSNQSATVECVDCVPYTRMFSNIKQSQSAELLHKPSGRQLGPNFRILFGGEERRRENDEKVRLSFFPRKSLC
jgi:hypothetical protein